MDTFRRPLAVLGLTYAAFVVYLVASTQQLPAQMASHFNASGQPDGWMPRSTHLVLMGLASVTAPLILIGIFSALPYMPPTTINLPDRDYWLAPERREETFRYLLGRSLWFACLWVGFFSGLQYLVIEANAHVPVRLSNPGILTLGGGFFAAGAVWVVTLVRHFRHAPKTGNHATAV